MDISEYFRIKITDTPAKFIEEYDPLAFTHNGWVYFEIVRGCYSLSQIGKLANNLLHTQLNKAIYFEAATTPGPWNHNWRPIQFCFIMDDFGIEYVVEKHPQHLCQVLQEHYEIS